MLRYVPSLVSSRWLLLTSLLPRDVEPHLQCGSGRLDPSALPISVVWVKCFGRDGLGGMESSRVAQSWSFLRYRRCLGRVFCCVVSCCSTSFHVLAYLLGCTCVVVHHQRFVVCFKQPVCYLSMLRTTKLYVKINITLFLLFCLVYNYVVLFYHNLFPISFTVNPTRRSRSGVLCCAPFFV